MFEGKVLILEKPYEETEEMEPFNKYGEDLSYDSMESHCVYESDSTLVVTNKRKFGKIEGTLDGDRNISGKDPFTRMGTDDSSRRMGNKEEASNNIKQREEGLGETALSLQEQKHSLSNENLQLHASGIESCFQRVTSLEALGTVDGVTNKNWREVGV